MSLQKSEQWKIIWQEKVKEEMLNLSLKYKNSIILTSSRLRTYFTNKINQTIKIRITSQIQSQQVNDQNQQTRQLNIIQVSLGNFINLIFILIKQGYCNLIQVELKRKKNSFWMDQQSTNLQVSQQSHKFNESTQFENSQINNENNIISLRGGGCGSSAQVGEILQLQKQTAKNKVQLPENFITDLQNYLEFIINKAQLASDERQKEEILIAFQWFTVTREHFNTLCIDSQSAASVYDIIFRSLPEILKSLVIYLRINGFFCIQVLQIINDLCRVLFTFYMTNEKRFMKIQDKEILDELIFDFETQLDIEQSNIWIAGAEFEITMIKAVIESSPTNSDEGQKLLITFLGGLVKSALTMSPTDDLISSLIDGAKFLYQAYKVQNLRKKYEIYYYFEQLKWNIIQLLRQDISAKRIIQLLQNAYSKYIENNKDWVLNFCWVKFVVALISYRPIITKEHFSSQNKIQQKNNWNQLIKNKLLYQMSFNKNLGRIQLFQDVQKQDMSLIIQQLGIMSFYTFNVALVNNLKYSVIDIFSFRETNTKEQRKIEYLLGQFKENTKLEVIKEQLQNQLIGLNQQYQKAKIGYERQQNSNKDNHSISLSTRQDNVENIQELIKQCLFTFCFTKNAYKVILLNFERFKIILNSIIIDNSVEQDIIEFQNKIQLNLKEIIENFREKCNQLLENLQQQKIKLIEQLVKIEIYFDQTKLSENDDQIMTEKYQIISSFFNSIDQFIQSCQELIEKLHIISEMSCKNFQIQRLTYSEEITFSDFEQLIVKVIFQNDFNNQISQIFEHFSGSQKIQLSWNKNLVIYYQLKYLIWDFINQINDYQEAVNTTINYLKQNKNIFSQFQLAVQSNQNHWDSKQIDEILSHQLQCVQQFFQQEEDQKKKKLEKDHNRISAENIIEMLKKDESILQKTQKNSQNDKALMSGLFVIALVKQYIQFYIFNPDQSNQTKEQITKLYQNTIKPIEKSKIELTQESSIQKGSQQYGQLIENLINQSQSQIIVINSQKRQCEIIQDVILNRIQLYEIFSNQTELNFTSQDFLMYTQEYDSNYYSILTKCFTELTKSKIEFFCQTTQYKQNEIWGKITLLKVILKLCDLLRPTQTLSININGQQEESKISNIINEVISGFQDQNYKARQCFVMSLMQAQSQLQEPHIIQFCQDSLLQIWTEEKDERVKTLLKNTELMEMQKNLFINDLKSFSSRLQTEMEERLNKMNDLEQKINLEGDSSIRQQLQEELQVEQQEFEDYLENVNDMASKLDIGIQFLKDIKRSLSQLKQKIDKLQDTVNNIGDDVRKLRGKTFNELLNIRKRKVLEQMQLNSLTQVYIRLNCQEYDPETGIQIENKSILLHDDFQNQKGEINEFLQKDQLNKDVFLLRGAAGSGKSAAARKIEEFLWKQIDQQQSTWIPIYTSLPTLKEPKFNLIDQALESDYYQFDKIQVKEFKEALNEGNTKIILILDSYDEMKQDCIQSNLYQTNRFQQDLFGNISDSKRVKELLKVIITTRTEVLTSNRYQTWFQGESISTLKEVELLGFDEVKQEEYLYQFTLLSMKKIFLEHYSFIKQLQKEKINFEEFCRFWEKIEDYLGQSHYNSSTDLMINDLQAIQIIQIIQGEKIFLKINKDQVVNIQKQIMELWSSEKFKNLIKSAQIEDILKTPFMMEIVVQVLPSLMKNYSDASSYKEKFIENFIQIKKSTESKNELIQKYQNQRLALQGYPQIHTTYVNQGMDFRQKAQYIWDQLQNIKFFQKFSLIDKFSKNDLNQIDESTIVLRALIIKQLTVFDFYNTFVKFYHQQQIKKQQDLGRMINEESFLIDLFKFSQSLATEIRSFSKALIIN